MSTNSGVVRQMRDLSSPLVTEAQVQRVLNTRVKRLGDQEDEGRLRVVSLVAQTVAKRNLHLQEDTFDELLQQMVLVAGQSVFEAYAVFFAAQVKNGYRLVARGLLQDLRFKIRNDYLSLGGFEHKLELRRSVPKLALHIEKRSAVIREIAELERLETADERARVLLRLW